MKKYGLNGKNDIKFIQNKIGKKCVKIYERKKNKGNVTVKERIGGR